MCQPWDLIISQDSIRQADKYNMTNESGHQYDKDKHVQACDISQYEAISINKSLICRLMGFMLTSQVKSLVGRGGLMINLLASPLIK